MGFWLYARITLLQRLFIPPALIAGVLLLLTGPEVFAITPAPVFDFWKKWPSFLISFLFAGIILGDPPRRDAKSARGLILPVLQQTTYVWFIAFSQLALGFLIVLFVVSPMGGEPLIGHILEIGWIGGHGSAAALKGVMERLGRPEIGDLGIFSATVGLLVGGTAGIAIVNLFRRRYPDRAIPEEEEPATPAAYEKEGDEDRATTLFFAILLLVLCVFAAYLTRTGAVYVLRGNVTRETLARVADFPLFSISLLWALAFRIIGFRLRLLGASLAGEVKNLTAIILDVLIVSAAATLKLSSFSENIFFFLVLMGAGAAWCVVLLLFIARRMLPEDNWQELGLVNFGMSTGVTALGLLLARSFRTKISEKTARLYGLAAPFSAPLVGGGWISLQLPYFTAEGYVVAVALGTLGTSLFLFLLGAFLQKLGRKNADG